MNTTTDILDYTIIADGIDAGRYATAEVAMQSYSDELYGYISDASKEAQGFRFRVDVSGMTFAELEAECDYWYNQAAIANEEEKEAEAFAVEEFKALVARTIELGAKDEEIALRWLQM